MVISGVHGLNLGFFGSGLLPEVAGIPTLISGGPGPPL